MVLYAHIRSGGTYGLADSFTVPQDCCDDNVTYTIRMNVDQVGRTRLAILECPSLIAQGFSVLRAGLTLERTGQPGYHFGLLHHPHRQLKQECGHSMFRLITTACDNWSVLENSLSRPGAFPTEP